MVGVVSGDDDGDGDDDGEAGMGRGKDTKKHTDQPTTDPLLKLTKPHVDRLVQLIDETGADYNKYLQYLKVDSLTNLPNSEFEYAERKLLSKKKSMAAVNNDSNDKWKEEYDADINM